MPVFRVRHHQAVWETTTFEVEAPDREHVLENVDDLLEDAVLSDRASIDCGNNVAGIDAAVEVEPVEDV